MDDSIFEMMERTQIVDKVLLLVGIAVPFLMALHYRLFRQVRLSVRASRWRLLAGVGAPLLWGLWTMFNVVANYYGIDSLFGFFMNMLMFVLAGGAFVGFDVWLRLNAARAEFVPVPDEVIAEEIEDDTDDLAAEDGTQVLEHSKANEDEK